MSKKGGKGVLKRLFSKDDNSEAGSSAGGPAIEKKKKKKGSLLRRASTVRDTTPPDSPGDNYDPHRLSTILSEGQTHAPTVTRAPTVTDYQTNAGYFDGSSLRDGSEIHIHDHLHGGMTSPTVLGGTWLDSPERTHLPLHVPPSRNASVRQAPSAITHRGTIINDHGSMMHAPAGSAGVGGSFRGTPSNVPLPESLENHTLRTHKSMRSQRTHHSSAQYDAPIYVHGAHQSGFEPVIVNAGAPPSASGNGNNYYVVDPAGHQRNAPITRQPTVITPTNADDTVLKPGDMMEIDPTNPPIFMLDDGVELEIDDGNGFMPYDQFMEEFRRRPAPPPPSTFVVHGAGDVIIQDEHGNHIQTIAGRGAEAGRGQPQRYNSPHSNLLSPHSPRSPEDALSPSWGERPLSYPSAMGGSIPASPRWEDGAPSPSVEEAPCSSQGEQDEEDVAHLSILRTPPTISVSRVPSLRRRRSDSDVSHHSSGSECSSLSWGRTEADRYSRDFDAKSFRFSQYSTSMSKDWDAEVGNGKRYSRDLDAPQPGPRKSLIRKGSFFSGLRPLSQRPDKSISPLFATLDLPPPPTFVPRVQSPPLASSSQSQSQSQSQAQHPAPRRRETTSVTAADRKNKVESKYLPSIRHALEKKISFGSFASMAKELLPKPATESQEGAPPVPANPSLGPTSPTSPTASPPPPVVKVRTKKLPAPTRSVPTAPAPTKPLSINTRKANDVKSQDVKSPGLNITSPKTSDVGFQPIFQSLVFPSVSSVVPAPSAPPATANQGHTLKHKGRLKLDAPIHAPPKAPAPAVDIFQPKKQEPTTAEPKEASPIIRPISKDEIERTQRLKHEAEEAVTAKEREESGRLQRIREERVAKQRAELEARIKAEVEAKIRTEFEEREREHQRLREEEAARLAAEIEAANKLKNEQEMARLEREAAEQRLMAQQEAEAEAKALEAELERARVEGDRLRKEEAAREAAHLQATRVAELERKLLEAQRQEELRRNEEERERKKREDEQRERIQQEKQLAVERQAAERASKERRRKEEQEQIEHQRHLQEKADRLARLEEEIRERERQAELEREKAEAVKREAEVREREKEERRVREAELVRIAAEHERRRKEELERLESELKQRLERDAELARRKAPQVAGQVFSTFESAPLPPPPPPPPYVPLSISKPARLVTKSAAIPGSAADKSVEASIPPPPPPPPPPPYALNKSAQKPTGILPTPVQLKPVPPPAISQFPTKDNPSSAPSSAKEEPRERRISLLDRTKTQASAAPIPLPIMPAFRARTTSHVRSNTSLAILSLIEKCGAGTHDQSGLFSTGSKTLTPTLTGATLITTSMTSGTSHSDGIESISSSPSDTAATLTIAPPTPTRPINIKANLNPNNVENHEQDKYDDTASPAVVESATKDIFIETSAKELSIPPKDSPPTTVSGPLEDPPRAREPPIDRVPTASPSLDPLPEVVPTSVTLYRPSTPSLGPAIPPKPAPLERRSSQVRRSSSIMALRSIFDKPAVSEPVRQAEPVQEIVAGPAPPRKVPPLAPKPKSSIARLSAFFEQQQQSAVSPRQSISFSPKPESRPALKTNAPPPTLDPEAHSPASIVDPILEARANTPSAKPADESSSPMAHASPFVPSTSAEAVLFKATLDPGQGVANTTLTSSIEVPGAIEPGSSPPKVSEALEASQPTSTGVVEQIAPTPLIKLKPILAPKPVGLVRSFSMTRATLVSPNSSRLTTSAGTPSPRNQTNMLSFDSPAPVAPSRRGSITGKLGTPPPLAPKPNLMSRRQSTTNPTPPLSSPLYDVKPGPREEPVISTTPVGPPDSSSSNEPAPLFPASPLSASPRPLTPTHEHRAPWSHEVSSGTELKRKLDEKEEIKIMEKERIEAETRRLQEEQLAVMLVRLEEEERERDNTAKETMESELKRKLEEKRKTKADTSKPWIKRKPKREEIDPVILASLTSLESRSATPLPLPEHKASTSEDKGGTPQSHSSIPAQADTNPRASNETFVFIPRHVPQTSRSSIVVILDEKGMVVSAQPTREQDDVTIPPAPRSPSLAVSRRGSTTPKAPSPPPLAPKPKFLTKSQTTTPAPTALTIPMDATPHSMHTPDPTNERLLGHAMSVGPSVAVPVISDRTLCDSPSRLSPREPLSEVNNPILSSVESLAEKMLERERVWSMDAEEIEAMAIQLADGEESAAERAKVEEDKREQERMSFEAAELELRRKQEEKRKAEMEARPLVEGPKSRKRQSGPSKDLVVGRTPSSSKEAMQATLSSALQTRRKGVPAGLIVPPLEVLSERSPVDHLPAGTTLGYSFTLLKPSTSRISDTSLPALSLIRVSEVTVVAQKPSPEDATARLPSTSSRPPTQHVGGRLTKNQPRTRGSDSRSSIIPPVPSPKPFPLVSGGLSSDKPSTESYLPSRPNSRTSIYDFGPPHDFTPATYRFNASSLEPYTHARKSPDPALMVRASKSPKALSPMHTGISVSSPIPIPSDLVTTAHGMPSSLSCLRRHSYAPPPNSESIARAVDIPRSPSPYFTDVEPSSSPAISEDSFVTAPTQFVTPTESPADLALSTARSPSPPLSLAVVLSSAPKFKAVIPQRRASLQGPSPVWITGTVPIPIPRDIEKERKRERETQVKLALQREKGQHVKEKGRARKSVSLPVPARIATTSTLSAQGLIRPTEGLDGTSGAIMPRWNDYPSPGFLSSSPSSSISTSPPSRPSTPAFPSSPPSRHSPRSPPPHAVMATLNPAHLPGGPQHVGPLRRSLTKQLEWDGRKFEESLGKRPRGRPRGGGLSDRSPSPQAVALGNAVKAYISPEMDGKKSLF